MLLLYAIFPIHVASFDLNWKVSSFSYTLIKTSYKYLPYPYLPQLEAL